MKLKCQPADFCVSERCSLPLTGGDFAVYELAKRSLGTWEAVNALAERWRIPSREIAFAGLKDKHAETRQTITIRRGPRKGLSQTNFEVKFLGNAARHVVSTDIAANEFQIAVRDLSDGEALQAAAQTPLVEQFGAPNYFDDQRFGSLGQLGEFIARPWCLGNWERVIWLILADASEQDSAADREQKRLLREHWGDWHKLLSARPRSRWRPVLEQLARRPGDFRGAIAAVPQELRSMYLAAYQSDLWNGMLSRFLERTLPKEGLTPVSLGRRTVHFFQQLDESLSARLNGKALPLPSARLHDVEESYAEIIRDTLLAEGLELRQLRVKYPRDSFFSKGDRPLLVRLQEFVAVPADDELYPRRRKLTLNFSLPRGSYATIVIKRLFLQANLFNPSP